MCYIYSFVSVFLLLVQFTILFLFFFIYFYNILTFYAFAIILLLLLSFFFFFCKQKTAYEMRISDWSSDVCSSDLAAAGGEAFALTGDIGDPAVPGRIVAGAVAALGGLDVLVSNAGVNSPGRLADLALEEWDRLFAVNTRPTWLLAKAAYRHLKAARGRIVAVASMSGMQPHTGLGAYSASKAALIVLVKQIAQAWAADGIRANRVSPGFVESPMTADLYADPAVRGSRERFVPLGRIRSEEHKSELQSL